MPLFEFEIITKDRLKLYGREWKPDHEVKAVVCLVHGLGEHCGRYGHVGEAFNRAGYALMACDLRGHGKSEGPRGHAPGYAVLMQDVSLLLEAAKECYPNLSCFLYGHSLGGSLAIHYVLHKRPKLPGVIASSPLLRLAYAPPRWKNTVLHTMHALRINRSIPSGLDENGLSRDTRLVDANRNDPLTHNRITACLAEDMFRTGEWNLAHAADFPCPLLLMHGTADRITSVQASREFYDCTKDRCTLKLWEGLYHELHNEPEQHQVLTYVTDWLDSHI